MVHLLAILKRTVAMIAGQKAIYDRLPSEDSDAEVLRFPENAVGTDWLSPDHKKEYGSFKQGSEVRYEDYENDLSREPTLFDSWLSTKPTSRGSIRRHVEKRENTGVTQSFTYTHTCACEKRARDANYPPPILLTLAPSKLPTTLC